MSISFWLTMDIVVYIINDMSNSKLPEGKFRGSLYISKEIHSKAKAYAAERGLSLSELVEESLVRFMNLNHQSS